MEASYEENGPKRRDQRRLGHWWVFFSLSSCFFIKILCFIEYIVFKLWGGWQGGQWRGKRAQTTTLASFGRLVSFFISFFVFFKNTNLCIAYILLKSRQGGQQRRKWARTSNEWAAGARACLEPPRCVYFLFFNILLLIFYPFSSTAIRWGLNTRRRRVLSPRPERRL